MKRLFLFMTLVVAVPSNAQVPTVTVAFSLNLANETLAAIEANNRLSAALDRRFSLCVPAKKKECIRLPADRSQDVRINVHLSGRAYQEWLQHLRNPGGVMDGSLRFDLCEALRAALNKSNNEPCVGHG